MSSLMSNTNVSSLFFQRSKAAVVRTTITGGSSMASSGSCVRGHPGRICQNGMATGKRSMIGSGAGPRTVRSNLSCGICKANSMPRDLSTGANSMWTARSSRQPEPPPADRMIIKRARTKREQGIGPALGYSRGGFSTKIHLVTDRQGLPLGAVLSAGQRHESAFFTKLMNEISVPRPRGRPHKRPEAAQRRSGLRYRLDPTLAHW